MKLQRKILLPALIAFATLMALLRLFILPAELAEQTQLAMQGQQKRLSVLGPIIAEEVLSGDIARIYEILENEEQSHPGWAIISFLDQENLMLYPFEKKPPPSGIDYYRVEHKVDWSGEPIGTLVLEMDTTSIQHRIADQIQQFELLIVGILLVSSLLGVYWNRKIVIKPITELAEAATELKAGNFDAPLPESSNDELGDLRHAFESMRRALQKAQLDAEQDNKQLQQAN